MHDPVMDSEPVPATRQIFANRTLNLRSIRAIGYDMDYTLVHYRVAAWEAHAYQRLKAILGESGWPVADLVFAPDSVIRGLVVDAELGNIVKANRFGYVVRAAHGTRILDYEEQRDTYRHLPIDLSSPRFIFLNTLFSLSESCLYSQLVDLYDAGRLAAVHGYADLMRRIRDAMDRAHVEGELKQHIAADPGAFVEPDPDAAAALVDQRRAGKRLMLITNSEWPYARAMMAHAFDPFLPAGTTWENLFELVIVRARKPAFFTSELPLFRVVDRERDLLQPVPRGIPGPGVYVGGDAATVEAYLGLSGADILYVGDHVFADVRVSKAFLRWRTALILRELEDEIAALECFRPRELELVRLMRDKEALERTLCRLRVALQRFDGGPAGQPSGPDAARLTREIAEVRQRAIDLDERIAPIAREASMVGNPLWGPLLRAGNDVSDLARQLEKSADVYTSRVGNLLAATPFAYLRAQRGGMPHDAESRY